MKRKFVPIFLLMIFSVPIAYSSASTQDIIPDPIRDIFDFFICVDGYLCR